MDERTNEQTANRKMDKNTNEQTDKEMDRQMKRWTDKQSDGYLLTDRWTQRQIENNQQIVGQTEKHMDK
jgi:cell division protein YceG involved in septum cleavage